MQKRSYPAKSIFLVVVAYLTTSVPTNNTYAETWHSSALSTTLCKTVGTDSHIVCWGRNKAAVALPPKLSDVEKVSLGTNHACALAGGEVHCWGSNGRGESKVPELNQPVDVSAGWFSTCALDQNGVKCWGEENASKIPELDNPTELLSLSGAQCARDGREVKCWPNYFEGKIPVPQGAKVVSGVTFVCSLYRGRPHCSKIGWDPDGIQKVPSGLRNARDIVAGSDHVCVLDDRGVHCWGDLSKGIPKFYPSTTIESMKAGDMFLRLVDKGETKFFGVKYSGVGLWPLPKNPKAVVAGRSFTCIQDDTGVRCFGNLKEINEVPQLTNPTDLTAGNDFVCALDQGQAVCWGRNTYGQLNAPRLTNPRKIEAGTGSHTACAIDDVGIHCWGSNYKGVASPLKIDNPEHLFGGYSYFCATNKEGIQCWGDESWGLRNPPAIESPDKAAGGFLHACVLKNKEVSCWGRNWHGETEPPAGLENPEELTLGWAHSCAYGQGKLQCWGWDIWAQFYPELKDPFSFDGDSQRSCAIDQGEVYCWGSPAMYFPSRDKVE